ncbi:MAG: hypothetical protein K6A30_09630 [Lachnospiraceae bacterium]|nr:hypothetical protein [Lachnospiraceae bacterium]
MAEIFLLGRKDKYSSHLGKKKLRKGGRGEEKMKGNKESQPPEKGKEQKRWLGRRRNEGK